MKISKDSRIYSAEPDLAEEEPFKHSIERKSKENVGKDEAICGKV